MKKKRKKIKFCLKPEFYTRKLYNAEISYSIFKFLIQDCSSNGGHLSHIDSISSVDLITAPFFSMSLY